MMPHHALSNLHKTNAAHVGWNEALRLRKTHTPSPSVLTRPKRFSSLVSGAPPPNIRPISNPSPDSAPSCLHLLSSLRLPLPHASCSLSGDSSSVMTVNSSVLPFSWIFSLFMRVTISCSRSSAWELDAAAAASLPSLASLDVIVRV